MRIDGLTEELLAAADTAAGRARGKVDAWEIFVASYRTLAASINGGAVASDDGEAQGAGVRVALGQRLGFAAATGLGADALAAAVDEAIAVARALGHEDRAFGGFAERRPPAREGPLDEALLGLSGPKLLGDLGEAYRSARAVKPGVVRVEEVQATVRYGAYAVVNSSGVEAATRFASLVGWASVTAVEGGRQKTGSDVVTSRALVDLGEMGPRAARSALAMLDARPLGRVAPLPTVWEPVTAAPLLEAALGNSINGRAVREGRSPFRGKLGEPVASKALTVHDDGQHPEGLATSAVDLEGVPRRRTPILEGGVLQSFLYDAYFGRLEGSGSTGNAHRGGSELFAATPRIAPTTLVVERGRGTREDLVAEVDEGILLTDTVMGLGHANTISGDFSAVATNPYLIRGGEIVGALEPVSLGGNLYRSLARVERVGEDVRLVGEVLTPSLVVDGLTVAG